MSTSSFTQDTIIVTGGNGYIASMFITRMLYSSNKNIIAFVRSLKAEEECYARIENELHHLGLSLRDIMPNRIRVLIVDETMSTENIHKRIDQRIQPDNVTMFFHAAGCKDCFDIDLLTQANVFYTERMLAVAESLNVDHFYYLSTTYCVGLRTHTIDEIFYEEPAQAVSNYAASMIQAEKRVHDSSLSTTIIRTSNVIGDSQTGRYSGKNYGLYACLNDLAEFILSNSNQQLHIISTSHRVNFIYQDVLMDALYSMILSEFRDEVIHIVSDYETSPTIEQLWKMWLSAVSNFKYVYTYEGVNALPSKNSTHFQQDALRRVHLFLEVAANEWQFSNEKIKQNMLPNYSHKSVTEEGVKTCLAYTFCNHPRLRANREDEKREEINLDIFRNACENMTA